ncbi:hypothetical protein NL676_027993 [Syzygium grande]|nr:hypothetical protein NL676_027993 [Syzygium grande]
MGEDGVNVAGGVRSRPARRAGSTDSGSVAEMVVVGVMDGSSGADAGTWQLGLATRSSNLFAAMAAGQYQQFRWRGWKQQQLASSVKKRRQGRRWCLSDGGTHEQ